MMVSRLMLGLAVNPRTLKELASSLYIVLYVDLSLDCQSSESFGAAMIINVV